MEVNGTAEDFNKKISGTKCCIERYFLRRICTLKLIHGFTISNCFERGKKVGNRAIVWGAIAGTIPDLDDFNKILPKIDALAFS